MSGICSKIKESLCIQDQRYESTDNNNINLRRRKSMTTGMTLHNCGITENNYTEVSLDFNNNNNSLDFNSINDALDQQMIQIPSQPQRITSPSSPPPISTRCLMSPSVSRVDLTIPTKRPLPSTEVMGNFVDKVTQMNKTVMVPNLLKDIDLEGDQSSPTMLDTVDMLAGFQMLNAVVNSILHTSQVDEKLFPANNSSMTSAFISMNENVKNLNQLAMTGVNTLNAQRQHSNMSNGVLLSPSSIEKKEMIKEMSMDSGYSSILYDSMFQLSSANSSPTSSAPSSDTDTEASSVGVNDMNHLVASFFHHLQGLNTALEQLTDTAKFITHKYEESMNVSSSF